MPPAMAAMRTRIPRAVALLRALHHARPSHPHWYLAMLGADPLARGRGVSSALFGPRLAECDATATAAHLETGNASNVLLYERYGFTLTTVLSTAGPSVRVMDRAPAGTRVRS
ncbi:hypothetical protein OG897_31270 [Streptomyces sp. NBC_00237]|uniref:hypothetical protein n=1 Tax=Streptomyces sp. NBC_00237 TaxID=2975687 RepID=UPI00224D9EC4|nr:hypothetical protein [Streptomyces sp. NBC_00237]MCX5205897.1 hypothetical protein [Streptomyces sp. NBC_00237]